MVISHVLFFTLGLLPSFAWLIFFLREDLHPEPKKIILKVFLSGFCITFAVIAIQFAFQDILNFYKISGASLLYLSIFALVEEILKFIAVYFVIRKCKFFDEPVDAMVYMITAALGFAMLENIAIMVSIANISEALGAITIRFVGATLLHALSSGIVGYWWAKGLMSIKNSKSEPQSICDYPENVDTSKIWNQIIIGIVIATVLHTLFNYLIIISEDVIIYPVIFLTIMAMFIFWDFEKIKSSTNNK